MTELEPRIALIVQATMVTLETDLARLSVLDRARCLAHLIVELCSWLRDDVEHMKAR